MYMNIIAPIEKIRIKVSIFNIVGKDGVVIIGFIVQFIEAPLIIAPITRIVNAI